MLEKVYGKPRNRTVVDELVKEIDKLDLTGTLYTGYPILATLDETISIEALLISAEHGLVVFDIAEDLVTSENESFWTNIQEHRDKLQFAFETNLRHHDRLRKRTTLGVPVNIVTLLPQDMKPPQGFDVIVAAPDSVGSALKKCDRFDKTYEKPLNAALQRVSTMKPSKKRAAVKRDGSRGFIIKNIERKIANLDKWQKRSAIETPEGPQRIRGLAGSGKTIVLALKAAYLHTQNPDWNIALTFHTRSLYQQFLDLVTRFSFEHSNDEPNFEKLRIIHAWGSHKKTGMYAEMATHAGVPIRNFIHARSTYGFERAFHGVCEELLTAVKGESVEPLYDAVLIDEAQDLPWPFFHLVHNYTVEPKRIYFAYDELQNLTNTEMPDLSDLFGVDEGGNARVELENVEGQARQDIVLPVCYRNTPWALTLAHAIGLGVYRQEGLVQHFDDPTLWLQVGYRIIEGDLEPGKQITLERRSDSYPPYFKAYLNPDDAIVCRGFETEKEQAKWVAEEIEKNIQRDELEMDDILIILPNPLTAREKSRLIMDALERRGMPAHLAGVTSSQDEIFNRGSIAISGIFRAKGNEAPMVYVLNCQFCVRGFELMKVRNILFTAITRSRAWVRLSGWGQDMNQFIEEVEKVRKSGYRLEFSIPTHQELEKMHSIHRDLTARERARFKRMEKELEEFLDAVQSGEMSFENLPPKIREGLRRFFIESGEAGHDD